MLAKINAEYDKIKSFFKNMPKGWFDALYNYFNYKGRINRFEFWSFAIFNTLILLVLYLIDDYFGFVFIVFIKNMYKDIHVLFTIYFVLTMIPYIFVCVRRLHDINCRGWWLLFVFIPIPYPYLNYFFGLLFIIAACYVGDKGSNRFGAEPEIRLN